jgi:hypothetical protein
VRERESKRMSKCEQNTTKECMYEKKKKKNEGDAVAVLS